jgi:molybdopterin-binding protein
MSSIKGDSTSGRQRACRLPAAHEVLAVIKSTEVMVAKEI